MNFICCCNEPVTIHLKNYCTRLVKKTRQEAKIRFDIPWFDKATPVGYDVMIMAVGANLLTALFGYDDDDCKKWFQFYCKVVIKRQAEVLCSSVSSGKVHFFLIFQNNSSSSNTLWIRDTATGHRIRMGLNFIQQTNTWNLYSQSFGYR